MRYTRLWKLGTFGLAAAAITVGAILTTSTPAGAARPLARAELRDADGTVVGEIVFKGYGSHVDRATIRINAPGVDNKSSYHGIHVHTSGRCTRPDGTPDFTLAGSHWNPTGAAHGHHKGDLPSVLIASDGSAYLETETPRFQVEELFDADGSAVILHQSGDNFAHLPGYTPSQATLATGDGGPRYACGVVATARE